MEKTKRLNRKNSGFTLIEVLVVILIVAILAAIAAPSYFKLVASGHATEAKNAISRIEAASTLYYSDHGDFPSDVSDMENDGVLDIPEATEAKWKFTWTQGDESLDLITATSLPAMRGGAGEEIVYNVVDGTFKGYGQPEK